MLIERRFGVAGGYVRVDWGRPVEVMVLEPKEAHCIADTLEALVPKAVDGLPSYFTDSPSIRMKAQERFACVHWGRKQTVWDFTKHEAARIAAGLREVAYKAERNERGLLPTNHDVNKMEEALAGEGRHRIIQHAAPQTDTAPETGGGLRIIPQGSFLSRLIRRPWA